MNTDVTRVVKAIAAVVVLTIIVIVVFGWWGDYRNAQPEQSPEPTSTTTPTVDSTKTSGGKAATTPTGKTTTVIVLIEGLNMREEPTPDGTRIRGLKKGDKLVLLKTQDSWYQVRAADKKVGWISANPQYTKLEE